MGILDRIRQKDTEGGTLVAASREKLRRSVLVRPIVTEKAAALNTLNKYVFEVVRTANKIQVSQAIEEQFGVKPIAVQVVNLPSKTRVRGRISGKTGTRRKAIVTLPAGKSISLAEAK